jgi:ATP-dependent Clp protease ATP-binding subunit ClpA
MSPNTFGSGSGSAARAVRYWDHRVIGCRRQGVLVEDLEIALDKMGEAARRIVDRAIDESRRRDHPLLVSEHIVLAFAEVEWDRFAEIMRDIDLDAQTILQAIEAHVRTMPCVAGRDVVVSPATKLTLKLALHSAARAGRASISPIDLFLALLEEKESGLASILGRHSASPTRWCRDYRRRHATSRCARSG